MQPMILNHLYRIVEWKINAKTNKKKFTKAHQQRYMLMEINVSRSKSWTKKLYKSIGNEDKNRG